MIHLVTYADDKMSISKDKCVDSAYKYGVEGCHEWDRSRIWDDCVDFLLFNKETLSQERGSGYWLWKPFVIYSEMCSVHVNDGDILIYSDAGVEFVAAVSEIISRMDEDIFFFTNGWPHIEWCKMNVLKTILPEFKIDGTERDVKQIQASVIFFRVSQKTRDFVKEWLLYSQMPGFIDDSPSREPNYPTFAEHRHDQAILTCLALKHGYTMDHWWPTQYSNHLPRSERDSYPVLFNHHRKRNNEW